MASQNIKIAKFFWGHAPDPLDLAATYTAEFVLATNLFTICLSIRLTVAEHPYNQA